MNKRVTKLIIFLLVLISTDKIGGLMMKHFYNTSNSVDIAKIRYSMDSTTQDILIFGSSRAQHHYIPDSISKYTKLSVYNCGIGGQGIGFSYIQIHETLKRYKPKLIILDLAPNILLDPLTDQKLKVLLPYHKRDEIIGNELTKESLIEKSKFLSEIYPYNGTAFSIVSSYIYYRPDNASGYISIQGKIDTLLLSQNTEILKKDIEIPIKQINYLERIIKECKDKRIKLLFSISPMFRPNSIDIQIINQLKSLASLNSISMSDFSKDVEFFNHQDLFKDNLHLNKNGAAKYSINIIRNL